MNDDSKGKFEQDPSTPTQEESENQQNAGNGNVSEHGDLKAQLDKAQSDYLYLRAEFDNYRKQMIKERSDYLKYGSERLLVEFLGILDNFERALQADLSPDKPESIESFRTGVQLTANEFKAVFKKFGVEALDAKGQPFDPNVHEALSSEETDAVKPGFISNVFRQGYKLHDRVIRPAQVIVAKAKTAN